jgi:hypothetical protein
MGTIDEDEMKRIFLIYMMLAGLIFLQGCSDEPGLKEEDMAEFSRLTWLKGIWEGRQGNATLYESWRSKSFRSLEGISYTTINAERAYIQTMRIEQSSNKITMTISIEEGSEETVMDLTEITDDKVVFTRASGSYPEQVIYTREGDNVMVVQLSGSQNVDAGVQEFRYKKTGET